MTYTTSRRRTINVLLSISIGLVIIAAAAYFYISSALFSVAIEQKDLKINIPPGTSIAKSIELFDNENVMQPVWLFDLIARFVAGQYDKSIKAGYYKFPVGLSNIDILKSLFTGEYLYFQRVTFPEGIGYRRFASILQKRLKLDSAEFVRIACSDSLLQARKIPAKSIEGYLNPATYSFNMDISISEVIDELLNSQDKLWKKEFSRAAANANKSRHQILTMASIVEAESPNADERPQVSGVYWNRISRNMLLQADPTVQYAINEKRRVLYADLQSTNLYNTYKYAGLPPGPINSPSISSIAAAINPDKHKYLFFVAIGDGSGRHNFGKTFDEHKRFVRQYRERLRKDKKR